MYKVVNDLSNDTFTELFAKVSGSTSLRSRSDLIIPHVRMELTGKSSVRYFGPLIWNTVPLELKQLGTLSDFKKGILENGNPTVLAGYTRITSLSSVSLPCINKFDVNIWRIVHTNVFNVLTYYYCSLYLFIFI